MLRRYISSHAFIHDDHWLGVHDDFDELSGHPLLLEAPLVVASRTGGTMAMARETVLTPGISPLAELAGSIEVMNHVARTIADQHLDISAFYADRAELSTLSNVAARFGYRPRIHPSPELFRKHSSHMFNLNLLKRFEGFPRSLVASTLAQAREFFEELDDGYGVYVKRTDSRSVRAINVGGVERYATAEGLPILLQSARKNRGTAVFQWIQDGSKARPLFVTFQVESESHHIGNKYTREFENEFFNRFEDTIDSWMSIIPRWTGPIAVDAILPINGSSPIAVDLNARFNSSTIPIGQALLAGHFSDLEYRRWDTPPTALHPGESMQFGQSLAGSDSVSFSLTELRGSTPLEAL